MTPQQIQDSIVQEQADRHAAKNSIIDRLQAENAALKEQVESDAIVSYIEGRINILCNKLAAKDETIALIAEQHKVKVLTDALNKLGKRQHYYCDDGWYSCPKAEDGCLDKSQGDDCNCGADKHNAEVEEALAFVKGE